MCGKCNIISFTEEENPTILLEKESDRDRLDFEAELDHLLQAQDDFSEAYQLEMTDSLDFPSSTSEEYQKKLKEDLNRTNKNLRDAKQAFLNNWQVKRRER